MYSGRNSSVLTESVIKWYCIQQLVVQKRILELYDFIYYQSRFCIDLNIVSLKQFDFSVARPHKCPRFSYWHAIEPYIGGLHMQDGPVYTVSSDHDNYETEPDDLKWWNITLGQPTAFTPLPQFLRRCIASKSVAGRWVAYNATLGQHRRVVPNVVTVAAVLDAVPLEPSSAAALGATTKVIHFTSDGTATLDCTSRRYLPLTRHFMKRPIAMLMNTSS